MNNPFKENVRNVQNPQAWQAPQEPRIASPQDVKDAERIEEKMQRATAIWERMTKEIPEIQKLFEEASLKSAYVTLQQDSMKSAIAKEVDHQLWVAFIIAQR